MVSKIQKLSGNTGHLLSLAACIGNRFDLNTLSIVYEKSASGDGRRFIAGIAGGIGAAGG